MNSNKPNSKRILVTMKRDGVLRWVDEKGMPRANNAAWRMPEPLKNAMADAVKAVTK